MMGSFLLGNLVWKIIGDTTGLNKNLKTSGKKATDFGSLLKGAFTVAAIKVAAKAVLDFGVKLVSLASDAEETRNKFNVVFASTIDGANAMAEELANGYGLAKDESQDLLSDTADLLNGFGITGNEALNLSGNVQKLAADLASFKNYSGGAAGASRALTKALLGETESLVGLGIKIQQDDLKRLAEQHGKVFDELTRGEKAQLTYEAVVSQSGNAIGDMARSMGSLANQQKVLNAKLRNAGVAIGEAFLPAVTSGTSFMAKMAEASLGVIENIKGMIGQFLEMKFVQAIISTVGKAFNYLFTVIKTIFTVVVEGVKNILGPFIDLWNELSFAIGGVGDGYDMVGGIIKFVGDIIIGITKIIGDYIRMLVNAYIGVIKFVKGLFGIKDAANDAGDAVDYLTEKERALSDAVYDRYDANKKEGQRLIADRKRTAVIEQALVDEYIEKLKDLSRTEEERTIAAIEYERKLELARGDVNAAGRKAINEYYDALVKEAQYERVQALEKKLAEQREKDAEAQADLMEKEAERLADLEALKEEQLKAQLNRIAINKTKQNELIGIVTEYKNNLSDLSLTEDELALLTIERERNMALARVDGNKLATAAINKYYDALKDNTAEDQKQRKQEEMYSTMTNLATQYAEATLKGFGAVGEAIAKSEDVWAAFAKSAINAIAGVIEALGQQLAIQAAAEFAAGFIPFQQGRWVAAAQLGIASAAAYTAAGVVKGFAGKFQEGGIVPSYPGVSGTGDNMVIRTNPGEMVLNRQQQAKLFEMINTGGGKPVTIIQNNTVNTDSLANLRLAARKLFPALEMEGARIG